MARGKIAYSLTTPDRGKIMDCTHQYRVSNGDGTMTCLICHKVLVSKLVTSYERYHTTVVPISKTVWTEKVLLLGGG